LAQAAEPSMASAEMSSIPEITSKQLPNVKPLTGDLDPAIGQVQVSPERVQSYNYTSKDK